MAETQQILNEVLELIAKEHNFVNCEIKVEPVSSGGANYTSILNAVTIKEGENIHHLFAKVGVMGEKMRDIAPSVYLNEIYVYTDLSKKYDSLQDRYEVPQEHRLTLSKYYGCNLTTYEEILVLENLVAKGYESFDRFKSIHWAYASSAVTELAKLHALSCAYSEYYPEEFSKVFSVLKFDWGAVGDYFKGVCQKAVGVVQEKYKEKLTKFLEAFGADKFLELFAPTRKPMLVHGDFRPSNLMHRIQDVSKFSFETEYDWSYLELF